MAKKTLPAADPAQEEELVVTVVRFKGSGETARKGIDALSQALSAAFGGGTVVTTRAVNGRKPAAQLGGGAPTDTIDTEALDDTDPDTGDDADDTEETTSETKAPAKPRKFEFVSNISDNAATPLKDFVAARNPTEINDKYLVACLWLQTEAGFDVFGGNHVWSCFQIMDWKKLADFTQPMRLMKSKKSYFDTPKKGEWKLNAHGLDVAKAIQNAAP
jgi:hypothetical protein